MNYFTGLILLNTKNSLSFGKDSLLWIIVRLLNSVIGVLVIFLLFSKTLQIEGFSREECLLIYALYIMSVDLFYSFFSWTLWYSNVYLLGGKLGNVLKLPVNPFLYITGSNFALSEIFGVINGFILFIYSSIVLDLNFFTMFFLLFFLILGTLSITGVFLIIASLGYKFPKIEEAFSPLMTLMQFAQYPITIYQKGIRFFLTYVFPIAMIAYYPSAFCLNKLNSVSELFFAAIYGMTIFSIGYLSFIKSVKKFEGGGN